MMNNEDFIHFFLLFDKEHSSCTFLGQVVQSIVSLMSSLMVKILTVLVSTNAKATHIFFQQKN